MRRGERELRAVSAQRVAAGMGDEVELEWLRARGWVQLMSSNYGTEWGITRAGKAVLEWLDGGVV